jgi:PAS domain S-box-containing protein
LTNDAGPGASQLSETWLDIADPVWLRIADEIPHITWMASPDGHVTFLNQEARDYLGRSLDPSPEQFRTAILHPDDAARVHCAWVHALDSRTEYNAEFRLRRADGEYFWHCGRALPILGAAGEVTHWIGTATDIDKHRRSEAALREFSDRLKDAQRVAHVGSWYTDAVTRTHQWSDEMYRLFGSEPGQYPPDPQRMLERAHPSDAGTMRAVASPRTSRPGAWEVELRIVLPDIGVRWLAITSEQVVSSSGDVVAVHGTAQDVTERKLSEDHLRFQANLLDAVGEAVIATDLTGTVIYWGPGAEKLYGWTAKEACGRAITGLIPPGEGSYDALDAAARIRHGGAWDSVMKLGRRDGSTITVQVRSTSVVDAQGGLIGRIGISSDVTAREEAHAELDRANRATAEALTLLGSLQAEAPVAFGFVDRDFCYVRLNHEFASLIGRPIEDAVGRKVADVVAPELWERLEPVYRHVLASGEALRNQPVTLRRETRPLEGRQGNEGEVREWLASHYPVRVDDVIIGIGIIVHDVTDRTRSEGFRSAVMSQVADGVYTQDCDGLLTYMNSAASKLLGWTESELRGKRMHDVVHFQNSDGTRVPASECALLNEGPRGRLDRGAGQAFTRKDGSTFPVAFSAAPLRIGSTPEGVAVVFRDVSEPGASPNVIRVILADSDRNATTSFKALLDRHEGVDVVAVAATAASAVESAERLRPDVALVSADLPDLDGPAATVAIKARAPSIKVILMSQKYDESIALAGIEAGCAGVLDKSRAWVELVSAVRAAYHGETIISQEELQRVLSKVRGDAAGGATKLTEREEQVLSCMRQGCSNAQVAEQLGVTANTVRNHVQRILYKLNVHSKLEAVVLTSSAGLRQGES